MARLDELARLVDEELHPVELEQQVVRELDVGLVDFVDQQHRLLLAVERLPQPSLDDVVGDVVHLGLAELRIAQPRDGVVFVEAVLRLGGGLDVPAVQRLAERGGNLLRKLRLAGAGLALDQQRARERHRRVDRHHQVVGRDVALGSFESCGHWSSSAASGCAATPYLSGAGRRVLRRRGDEGGTMLPAAASARYR